MSEAINGHNWLIPEGGTVFKCTYCRIERDPFVDKQPCRKNPAFTPPAPPTKTGGQAVGEIKTRYKCGCCGQEFRPTGMLGGRLSCGCETAKCSVCGKCSPDHCKCEWGRPSQVEKIREFAKKRLVSPRYRFDEATGHIFDGDHAVAYSHVKQWGHELADALNTRTAEREALRERGQAIGSFVNEIRNELNYARGPFRTADEVDFHCDKALTSLRLLESLLAVERVERVLEGKDG